MPERRADDVVGRAVDWIAGSAARFFAWVHVFDPHSPYKPPPTLSRPLPRPAVLRRGRLIDRALGPLFDRLTTLSRPTLVDRDGRSRRKPRRAR